MRAEIRLIRLRWNSGERRQHRCGECQRRNRQI